MSEAERFGHTRVAEFLLYWLSKEMDGGQETLTAKGGEELLQKLKNLGNTSTSAAGTPTVPK